MATVWYYNSDSGAIDSTNNIIGWIQDKTQLSDLLNWHGPFNSKEQAFQYYVQNHDAHPDWKEPTDSAWQQFKNSNSGWMGNVGDVIGISGGQIDVGNWFIRVGEIILGIVLIGVGVAKLTGTTNVISKIARVA